LLLPPRRPAELLQQICERDFASLELELEEDDEDDGDDADDKDNDAYDADCVGECDDNDDDDYDDESGDVEDEEGYGNVVRKERRGRGGTEEVVQEAAAAPPPPPPSLPSLLPPAWHRQPLEVRLGRGAGQGQQGEGDEEEEGGHDVMRVLMNPTLGSLRRLAAAFEGVVEQWWLQQQEQQQHDDDREEEEEEEEEGAEKVKEREISVDGEETPAAKRMRRRTKKKNGKRQRRCRDREPSMPWALSWYSLGRRHHGCCGRGVDGRCRDSGGSVLEADVELARALRKVLASARYVIDVPGYSAE
jgi:hypothetical protein